MIVQGIAGAVASGIRQSIASGIDGWPAPPEFIAAGTTTSDINAIAPPWPTHLPGDIGLLPVETANQSFATPSGWTEVSASPQGSGTGGAAGSVRLAVFWRRAVSNAESAPSVADSGDHQVGRVHIFRGCIEEGNPIDVAAGNTGASSTSVAIPGVTTTKMNELLVALVSDAIDASGNRLSAAANANLESVVEQTDFGTAQGVGGGIACVTGIKRNPGATGNTTGTLSSASAQARIALALRSV